MGKDDTLFTTQQAASALGVSDSYVRRLIGMGKAAPHSRVGHIYVFTAAEIERIRNRTKGKAGRPPKKVST